MGTLYAVATIAVHSPLMSCLMAPLAFYVSATPFELFRLENRLRAVPAYPRCSDLLLIDGSSVTPKACDYSPSFDKISTFEFTRPTWFFREGKRTADLSDSARRPHPAQARALETSSWLTYNHQRSQSSGQSNWNL